MKEPFQPLLFEDAQEADIERLTRILASRGWTTRAQLAELTGLDPREIRAIAESSGGRIVRGPKGFNLATLATLDELHHSAAIAESQAMKMLTYAQAVRKHAHARVAT